MYGVVTRNAEETEFPEFARAFYEVKDVTGHRNDPITSAVNMVSCFGDNAAGADDPSLVPVSVDGDRATRDQPYFDWAYICPNRDNYREELLNLIASCAAVNPDVRLDDIGFPRAEYCYCEICQRRFHASEYEDRMAWRANVITDFVRDAAAAIPGRVYLTLYPDPYPGHLLTRSGIDLEAIEDDVDEFIIPLYDMAYTTTYWLEIIAAGFVDTLATPFSIELYAVNVDVDRLAHAAEVAEAYAETVLFSYAAETARAVVDVRRSERAE